MVAAAAAPLSIGSDMSFGASVEARQRLPYPGRLRLAGEVARLEALGAEEEIEVVALDLAHLAAELYHQLYLVERAREVNAEHVRLLGEVLETATARYAAGLAPQQAPLQAEVEVTHVVHRDLDLATDRRILVARLNALLHRPAGSPLPPAAEPPLRQAPPAVLAASGHHGPAVEAAPAPTGELPPRPELSAAAAEIEARRLEVELAELARRPDVDLMTSYHSMWAGGEHRWMIGIAVELPVRRARLAAAEAEAEARLAAAESRREALADEIRADVEAASQHFAHTAHIVELYRDRLGPASRDQLRAARTGLETGHVDLGTVIEAERNLRDVELTEIEALVEVSRAQVALDRALGRLPGGGRGSTRGVIGQPIAPPPTTAPADGGVGGSGAGEQIDDRGAVAAPRTEAAEPAAENAAGAAAGGA
jgi:outer membrane protein TolC